MTRVRRLAVLLVIAAGCASPLTVAEDRDAAAAVIEGGLPFAPGTPKDGSFDGEEGSLLTDPPVDAARE